MKKDLEFKSFFYAKNLLNCRYGIDKTAKMLYNK